MIVKNLSWAKLLVKIYKYVNCVVGIMTKKLKKIILKLKLY
jgi:hypothetical protein